MTDVLYRIPGDRLLAARLLVGVLVGGIVTLGLFWVMQYLIATADRSLDEAERGALVDFVRVKRAEIVERRRVKPKKPPPPPSPVEEPTPRPRGTDRAPR